MNKNRNNKESQKTPFIEMSYSQLKKKNIGKCGLIGLRIIKIK